MIELSTAVSGLRAAQAGLQTSTHNITNANTAGYTRQVVDYANRPPISLYGGMVGTGVEVAQIRRLLDESIQSSIISNGGRMSAINAQADVARQFELLLADSNGGVGQELNALRDSVQGLTSRTEDPNQQGLVVNQARRLARAISEAANELQRTRESLMSVMQAAVSEFNEKVSELVSVNEDIRRAMVRKLTPNDLFDRRDQLLNELGQLMNIDVYYNSARSDVPKLTLPNVLFSDGEFQLGTSTPVFKLAAQEDGTYALEVENSGAVLRPDEGKLGAWLNLYNEEIPDYIGQLDDIALSVIHAMDPVHATGIPTTAGFDRLRGVRGVAETGVPLEEAMIEGFDLQSGRLFVGVIDHSANPLSRELHAVDIDVTVDSLEDVAAKISAVPHIDAVVDYNRNSLTILAEAGYGFDFTGRPSTTPDTTGWTGTTVVRMAGAYTERENRELTFRVAGNGVIGISDDLEIEVYDAGGQLLNTLQVGKTYSPSTPLLVAGGITMSFTEGSVVDGETFTTSLVGQPDETGLLVGLGLNSLFQGVNAAGMGVRDDIVQDPSLLATSATGDPGNILPLDRLLEVFDGSPDNPYPLLIEFSEFYGQASNRVADLEVLAENASFVDQTLRSERDSLSGVDPDEELIKILEFQRAYQAASRIILISDEMLQDLMNMVR